MAMLRHDPRWLEILKVMGLPIWQFSCKNPIQN